MANIHLVRREKEKRKEEMKKDHESCECEHNSHFKNGNSSHDYGAAFHKDSIVAVKTDYGIFFVCKDCEKSCLKEFIIKNEEGGTTCGGGC